VAWCFGWLKNERSYGAAMLFLYDIGLKKLNEVSLAFEKVRATSIQFLNSSWFASTVCGIHSNR